jgi:hypothetical protein
VLENKDCTGQYYHQEDLKTLIESTGTNLDFVFMATCHSQKVASTFLEAGAKHVIGISRDEEILDEAVLTFTETFYTNLWKSKSRINNCYERAVLTVEARHGEIQAKKFIKWSQDDLKNKIFGNFKHGELTVVREKPILWDLPPPINNFVGYRESSQNLIEQFFSGKQQFARLYGMAGVGKSALASQTIHYVQQRRILGGGCIYLDARGFNNFTTFM